MGADSDTRLSDQRAGAGFILEQEPPELPWGVVWLGRRGNIVSMDGGAEALFGLGSPGIAGQAFESLLAAPPSMALPWQAAPASAVAAAEWQHGAADCQARRGDGTLFPIELLLRRVAHEGPGPPGVAFVAIIHKLGREATHPLAPSPVEKQLRALIELAPIAVWVAEGERVVFANRAAGKLLGLDSGAALIGKSVYALLSAADHEELSRRLADAVRHEGHIENMQAHLLCHDREAREVEIALAALPDHGRTTVQMVVSNISRRNRELREMQRSRQLLKRLSAHVVEAREEERRHIARELHDELSQRLSVMKMDIAHCARAHSMPGDDDRVAALLVSLDEIVASVRRIASNLRPPMLDDLGLGDAIEALAADFSRRLGIRVRLHREPLDAPLDEKVSIAAYRMVQEALTNVARHAQASEVQIELRRSEGELMLSVCDDGVGLPSSTHPQRDSQFGLLGMQERADALGGSLQVENLRGGGVRLIVHLPVDPPGRKAWGTAPPSNHHAA